MATSNDAPLWEAISSASFLEYAFLRWILAPAARPALRDHIAPQADVTVDGRTYRVDYEFRGRDHVLAVELDGFAFHGSRAAFTYDRLRQNDLHATGRVVIRFSYDSIRTDTARCIAQLQTVLRLDALLATLVRANVVVETPEMDPDPLASLRPSPFTGGPSRDGERPRMSSYFNSVRERIDTRTLRQCQSEAFAALANYYGTGGGSAACVMSVGAGKTALGVLACLAFARRRAIVVTPGTVIRGTFDTAFDHEAVRNVLYGLPGGPLIPGSPPPRVLTLDRDEGPIKNVTRDQLLAADVIVTNFHSLGTGKNPDDLLSKLGRDDIDYIVVDEAHIAAAESYQRTFNHFDDARQLFCCPRVSSAWTGSPSTRTSCTDTGSSTRSPTGTRRICASSASHLMPSRRRMRSSGPTGFARRSWAGRRSWR